MHELSIAMSIVEIATDHALKDGAEIVTEIEIEVGDLSGVETEALDFAMEAAIKDTICRHAKWNIVHIGAKAFCPEKKKEYDVSDLYSSCPFCGEYGHELKQGKEMRVKSLIVE